MKSVYTYSVEKVAPVAPEGKVEYSRPMQWYEFRKVNPFDVLKVCCEHFGVTVQEAQSANRKQPKVMARMYYGYLLKEDAGLTYYTIGGFINRDHSSVVHYVRTINNQMPFDERIENTLDILRQELFDFYRRY